MRKAVGKTVAALAAAIAAVLLGLHQLQVVQLSRTAIIVAVIISAGLAAVSTIAGSWSEWRQRQIGARQEAVDALLTTSVWAIVDLLDGELDYRDLGLAAYESTRSWWPPLAPSRFRKVRLVRLHRVRASRRPVTSDMTWRPGKGVIGACVEQGQVVAMDLRELYDELGDVGPVEWAALPSDVSLGLSWQEFLDIRDKYDVVVAMPILQETPGRTQVRGVVALDGPAGTLELLSADRVVRQLGDAAKNILLSGL